MTTYWFDQRAATIAERFFDRMLVHIEGPMAGEPFVLEPWQRTIVRDVWGWKGVDGRRRYRKLYLEIPRGNGKMLCMNTAIPTPNGWTTISQIGIGDYVFAPDGSPCRVTAVSDVDPSPVSYRIAFSNGETIIACADHQWVTTARVNMVGTHATKVRRDIRRWKGPTRQIRLGKYVYVGTYGKQAYAGRVDDPDIEAKVAKIVADDLAANPVGVDYLTRVRTTQEIYETQRYGSRGDSNHSLRMPLPLQLPDADLPIDPYMLGVWLGDGNTGDVRVTCGAEDLDCMVRAIKASGHMPTVRQYKSSRTAYTLTIKGLQKQLRTSGLLGNKHIPAQYLRASYAQRLALLQGLMDTDGTVNASGNMFEYVTTVDVLAGGVGELLATMGIKYTTKKMDAKLRGRVVGQKWRIQFNIFRDEVPVFRMQRKLDRMRNRSDVSKSPPSRSVQIVSVEPCAPVPMRCIEVDHPSHEYLCGRTMLPTHNSTFAAGLALLLLAVDGERSAKVYSAAADKHQAAIVFETAEKMVEASPFLKPRIKPYRNRTMEFPETSSRYITLSSDAYTKHGLNPHGIVFDELHAQPNRELYDVLNTAMGKRRQPLMIMITTAGYDRNSICWEQHEYARQVADGIIEDPTFYSAIWSADETDDWTSPATWKKANPNYGVSVREDFLRQECITALASPAYQNTFRRLYLNQWTQQESRFIPMEKWDACGLVPMPDLAGRVCYGGLDLATTTDIAALVLAFPPVEEGEPYWWLPRFWVPQDNMIERVRRDKVAYDAWVRDGYVVATEGNVIDYGVIQRDIEQLGELYDIKEIAFDRWGATQISQNLTAAGFEMVQMGQGFASMSAPTKEMLRLVLAGQLGHGGQPVLRWMADNTAVVQDPAGNVKPSKAKSSQKIDGIVAGIMAQSRATVHGATQRESVYEERGLRVL